ncbi:hypothetical protein N8I77_000083 [Diaporthe amygdali]|uniref:F-box domain-containing protein n=1 Tax=Phomopsis amygdali TaxID=1214568 RepID=A0AAD9W8Q8_PHOAM|nr:hypothetical protein N8I77_000083 [Diaporthe amygdali]
MMESHTGPRNTGYNSTRCRRLPPEVWMIIFSFGAFDQHGTFWSIYDPSTLASLCRSCTLFRDLATPMLYRNFDSRVFTNQWHYFSVAKFTRTICTIPRLASFVRKVNIQGACDMFGQTQVKCLNDPKHPMASILISKAAELNMELKYFKAYTDINGWKIGFDLVALVLAYLPLIDTLNLDWFDTSIIDVMPRPQSGWPWRHTPRYTLSRVLPLLESGEGLTRLSIFGSTGPPMASPFENLREATLCRCEFAARDLRKLVERCTHLRKFVYMPAPVGWKSAPGAKAREVIEALEPARGTLEVLGIDFRLLIGRRGRRISSFQSFLALKTLYVDLACVWDWEAGAVTGSSPRPDELFTSLLPESIQTVALFGTNPDAEVFGFELEAHVKRLASDIWERGRFQQLRLLRPQGFWPFGYGQHQNPQFDDACVRRIATLDEANIILSDSGVELICDEESDSDLQFQNIMWFL